MRRIVFAGFVVAGVALADRVLSVTHSSARSLVERIELVRMLPPPVGSGDGGWRARVCGNCREPNGDVIQCRRLDGGDIGQCDECELGALTGAAVAACAGGWKTVRGD